MARRDHGGATPGHLSTQVGPKRTLRGVTFSARESDTAQGCVEFPLEPPCGPLAAALGPSWAILETPRAVLGPPEAVLLPSRGLKSLPEGPLMVSL